MRKRLDHDASRITVKVADALSLMSRTAKTSLEIHLRGKSPCPEMIEAISKLRGEVELRFEAIAMTDAEIARLNAGQSITSLEFNICQLTGTLWPTIASMPALTHFEIKGGRCANPLQWSIDLGSCRALTLVIISPSHFPALEIYSVSPPPNLEHFNICANLKFAALEQIFASAPSCEVYCDLPDEGDDSTKGNRYRFHEGKIQTYPYHYGKNIDRWLNIFGGGPGWTPPWRDVKEATEH